MSGKKRSSEFFFILLLVSTIIVSVVVLQNKSDFLGKTSAKKQETEDILLGTGWNLVSTTLVTGLDAKAICDLIPPEVSMVSICKYEGSYTCRYCYSVNPTDNFPIIANQGYFISSDYPGTFSLSLTGVRSRNIPLVEGYAMVGFPKSDRKLMASKLCGRYQETSYKILKLNKYLDNGTYQEYDCEIKSQNDFEIEKNKAYWVMSELITKPRSGKNVKVRPSVPRK